MMAFPTTPLDVKVELQLAGTWTDITSYTYTRSPITITRGRSDESSTAEPSRCSLMLNNQDGRFSPRNPVGPYYGLIGRNTPIRVSTRTGTPRLVVPAAADMSAPDSAGLSITGDIDLRVDASLTSWAPNVRTALLTKATVAGQLSYRLGVSAGFFGSVFIEWSADGTNFVSQMNSTVPLPATTGRQAIRATLDVDNGAAGRTATFYYAATLAGPWTQLGDPVVVAGTTSIFDGNSVLSVQCATAAATFYGAEVRSGIGGTLKASPDFTAQSEGTTSFADAQGNTWTASGSAVITARRYRFYGEVSAWPQAWDLSGKDVWVPAEAAGVLRRLAQASDPLKSSLQRYVLRSAVPAYGYWSMEDSSGSTTIASGLSGGAAMSIVGTPQLAAFGTFASSNPLPELALASFTGAVSAPNTGTIFCAFAMNVPAGETSAVLLRVYTTGTAVRWDLSYVAGAGGGMKLQAFDANGVQILSVSVGYPVDGVPAQCYLQMVQSGSDIAWSFGPQSYVPGAGGLGGAMTGTLTGQTVGAASVVQVNPDRTLNTTTVGHLAVFAAIPDTTKLLSALRGWAGETAGRRVERLCGEEGITFTAYGGLDLTEYVGAQRPLPLVDLLNECETADRGQLFETREALGLGYRTRDSRQYQNAVLALTYGNLSELVPVEDDQATKNDVTVNRVNGSSYRVSVDTGTLSTQAPPNGVGRYPDSVDVNLYTDSQTANHAQWRATEGTIDEARYPTITAHLEAPAFSSSSALTNAALGADHGDLITITSPPAWLPPDTIRQHTIGQVETLNFYAYEIDFVCVPATPYRSTGLYDDGTTRYAGGASTLASGVTSGATSLVVTTATGTPLWTQSGGDFPLDTTAGGEQMTVSTITGFASDTFTRTVAAGGWGTSDLGGAWTPDAGATDFSVNGTRGVISTAVNTSRTARLLAQTTADVDVYVTVDVAQIPTGDIMETVLRVRHTGTDNYNVFADFATAGTVTVSLGKSVSGVSTTLGTVLAATTYTVGTGLRLRLRASGSTISAKAWLASGAEPTPWGLSVTDTGVTAAGAISIGHFRGAANTSASPAVFFDNLSAPEPQVFTVTRSVNGVIKAHSAGEAIDIYDPDYYSF